jgi:hypothetical protein
MEFLDIVTFGRRIEAHNDYGREFYSDDVQSLDAPERVPGGSTRRIEPGITAPFMYSSYVSRGI